MTHDIMQCIRLAPLKRGGLWTIWHHTRDNICCSTGRVTAFDEHERLVALKNTSIQHIPFDAIIEIRRYTGD